MRRRTKKRPIVMEVQNRLSIICISYNLLYNTAKKKESKITVSCDDRRSVGPLHPLRPQSSLAPESPTVCLPPDASAPAHSRRYELDDDHALAQVGDEEPPPPVRWLPRPLCPQRARWHRKAHTRRSSSPHALSGERGRLAPMRCHRS
jgi:hypothetical protein